MGDVRRTFDEVAVEFVDYQGLYNSDRRGAASNARIMGRFFSGKILTDVRTRDIQNMVASRRLAGAAPATINRHRAFLSTMFNWSIERGYHPGPNPVRAVKRFREPRSEPRILTPKEARALIRAADRTFRIALVLALYTGARRGELWALTPSDVDLDRCLIRFRKETTKSHRERLVPVPTRLRDQLIRIGVAAPGRQWVLEDGRGNRLKGRRWSLEEARRIAGLPWVTWVTLRHTFSGWFLTNGGEISRLQDILGHANPMTTMIYKHFLPDHGSDAARFIGPPRKASRAIEEEE